MASKNTTVYNEAGLVRTLINSSHLVRKDGVGNANVIWSCDIDWRDVTSTAFETPYTSYDIIAKLEDILSRLEALENNQSPVLPELTFGEGELNGITKNWSITTTQAGTITLSTNAGTLQSGSSSGNNITFDVQSNNLTNYFTIKGNAGSNASTPTITLTEGTMTNNQCEFTVKSTASSVANNQITLSTTAGELSTSTIQVAAGVTSTVTITNNGSSSISPTITATQTIAGTKGANINYVITATQNGTSKTQSGSITGSQGASATAVMNPTNGLTINNIPAAQSYYWYVGTVQPTISTNPASNLDNEHTAYSTGWTALSVKPENGIKIFKETTDWSEVQWYLAAPAEWNYVTSVNETQVRGWDKTTISINNVQYNVWTCQALASSVNVSLANV